MSACSLKYPALAIEPLTLRSAKEVVGDLSRPSKMPGRSYNLPAQACRLGSLLVAVPGTVCESCYALKGRYRFPAVRASLTRRLQATTSPRWVEAMAFLINHYESPPIGSGYFRWHDSGDLQSVEHSERILAVCMLTPDIKHWLPTRESGIIKASKQSVPSNLTVRISLNRVGQDSTADSFSTCNLSTVGVAYRGYQCPARTQGNACGSCRACWSRDVKVVNYPLH